jgi:hypothetical protein
MRPTKLNFKPSQWTNLPKLAMLVILLAAIVPLRSMAQQHGQKSFSSPEEASNALVAAAQANDEKTMIEILGADGKQLVSSGDEAEDADSRANFVQKYKEMHRLVKESDAATVLYIGAENWPTPIPLVNKGKAWYFDTEAGKKEILFRRVGRNEMSAIRICQELVAAQKEYYSTHHNEYAQKIFSDEGQHNGLYWTSSGFEPQSPIGPLVASAVAKEHANHGVGAATPYRGYYFQIVTRQGKNASGGAKGYVVNGKMTGGFAFLAYPAEYRSSGVMTFMVNKDGVVLQKDLGPRTDFVDKIMNGYNPDSSWEKTEEQHEESADSEASQ